MSVSDFNADLIAADKQFAKDADGVDKVIDNLVNKGFWEKLGDGAQSAIISFVAISAAAIIASIAFCLLKQQICDCLFSCKGKDRSGANVVRSNGSGNKNFFLFHLPK